MTFLESLRRQAHLAPAFETVALCVMVLATLAALTCIILITHHAYTSARRRRRTRLVQRAAHFLAPRIASGEAIPQAAADSRRQHGDWATSIVLREARGRVTPARAAELSSALDEMGEVARLTKLAGSSQGWRRSKAVRELGQCGGDGARLVLLDAARDTSPEVRRGAREGLLSDRRPESVKAAIRAYLGDPGIGIASKRSFYSQLASTAGDDLRDLLRAGTLDRAEVKLALEAMGDARNADVLPVARELLASPDPEIRATAARVVGKMGDQGSADGLEPLLDDGEWYVRAAAARAFESIRSGAESRRRLAGRLHDDVWWVRANAAHALAQQGDGGVDALLEAVEGRDEYSRDAALAALGLAVVTPRARQRLQDRLDRHQETASAAPLHRLLEAIPAGARP
jgi:HEAT repeat protein